MKAQKYDRRTIMYLLNAYFRIEKELKDEDPTFHFMLNHVIYTTFLPFARGRNMKTEDLNAAAYKIVHPLIRRCDTVYSSNTLLKVRDIIMYLFPQHFTIDELIDKNESELTASETGYLQAIKFSRT